VKRSTLPRYAPTVRRDLVAVRFLVFTEQIELPAQGVGDLSDEELRDLEAKAVSAFDAIRNKEDLSDEDVAEAERLSEIVTTVRTELGSRDEAVTSRRNRVQALGNDIDAAGQDDDEEGEPTRAATRAPRRPGTRWARATRRTSRRRWPPTPVSVAGRRRRPGSSAGCGRRTWRRRRSGPCRPRPGR
jgi:hypothetical protein